MTAWDIKKLLKLVVKRTLSLGFCGLGGFALVKRLKKRGVAIVTYHRIIGEREQETVLGSEVRQSALLRQIRFFKKHFTLIALDEAIERIRQGTVDGRYLAITFDDGYRDNLTMGQEIFKHEQVYPTIFVVTGPLTASTPLWVDELRHYVLSARLQKPVHLRTPDCTIPQSFSARQGALSALAQHVKRLEPEERRCYLRELQVLLDVEAPAEHPMLTWDQVDQLARDGAGIGAHTVNHPVLSAVSHREMCAEIEESKKALEDHLQSAVTTFAYPNGEEDDLTEAVVRQVRQAGFLGAVTMIPGWNDERTDPFLLRRIAISCTDSLWDIRFKLAVWAMR